ncbi:cation diffusion facilitator family transporter [Candidatus Halobeggiatoa sp. HSG11]|nr:cation diffusion facilitator family transporter [Candidatus Halobeggiatoa sp. HSG11]
MSKYQKRYITIRNVTLVGVLGNVLMTIIKLGAGFYGKSQALIADGLHSLSDLISDGVVLVAAKYGTANADIDHPYGHARFETLATVIIGALLIMVAIGMFIDASRRLIAPDLLLHPSKITLFVATLSILVKEALYQYTTHIAKKINSNLLQANAWHHRSDAISSVIVLIGIAGSIYGFPWLDAVAAIGVSFMIAHVGWSLGWGGVSELVDTGLDSQQLANIKQIIKSTDGVVALHELRTRKMGGTNILIDVHIIVNSRITVSEGHQIGEKVRSNLENEIKNIKDVLVHIDPENDERTSNTNLNLPSRAEIMKRLQQEIVSIEYINLHYLSGKIIVDVYVALPTNIQDIQAISLHFTKLVANEPDIEAVNVYYH